MVERIYRNRIADALDRSLFVYAFLGGTAGIIATKVFVQWPWLPAAWGVSVVCSYAAAVWLSPRFRSSEDRAGDSAYYLGFLFTLVSLAYALWEFSAAKSSTADIIANFSVALSTTITGLMLRVWLQQLREDPVEFEQETRLELVHATSQFKMQLLQGLEDLSAFRDAVRTEVQGGFSVSLQDIARATATTLQAMSASHNEKLQETLGLFSETVREMNAQLSSGKQANKKLTDAIERLASRVDKSEVPSQVLREKFLELAAAIGEAVQAETQRLKRDDAILARVGKTAEGTEAVLAEVLGKMADLRSIVDLVKNASGEMSKALGPLSGSFVAARDSVDSLVAAQSKSLSELVASTQTNVSAVRAAETELTSALARSRTAVKDTHDRLATLADTIVERLDGRQANTRQ